MSPWGSACPRYLVSAEYSIYIEGKKVCEIIQCRSMCLLGNFSRYYVNMYCKAVPGEILHFSAVGPNVGEGI